MTTRAEEEPIFQKPKQKEPRRSHPVRRTVLSTVAAAGITVGGIMGGLTAAGEGPFSGGTFNPNSNPSITEPTNAPLESSGVIESSSTVTPTPEPTSVPTPEPPKVVYQPLEQIIATVHEAQAQGKDLIVDTWSFEGASSTIAKSYIEHDLLVIDGFKNGDIFYSPVEGTVTSVAVGAGRGFKMWAIYIEVNGKNLDIGMDYSNQVLVKTGQKVIIGTQIAELSGNELSPSAGVSKKSQIAIGLETKDNQALDLSDKNILKDQVGTQIGFKPQ